MIARHKVAVLGAQRFLGQYVIDLLRDHPWLRLSAVADIDADASRSYDEAVDWLLTASVPDEAHLPHQRCGEVLDADLVISMLPDGHAEAWERSYAEQGMRVITHAADLRLAADVPLLLPELSSHATMPASRIVATPNCTTVLLGLPLWVLEQAFGIEAVIVTTLQAVSGADLPGHPALLLADAVLSNMGGEEAALTNEIGRLFGDRFPVSVQAVRVPVRIGHTLLVSVKLKEQATRDAIERNLSDFAAPPGIRDLPSAIARPLRVVARRPSVHPDCWADGGMAITVGCIRPCPVLDWRFTVVGNNMIRGAAGTAILAAEWITRARTSGDSRPRDLDSRL